MRGQEKNINKLPSVPEVLLKLLSTCRATAAGVSEVVAILQHDAALVARIIELGGSDPGLNRVDPENLGRVVAALGLDVVASVASSTAVSQFYSGFWAGREQHLSLWSRSLECACLARALARTVDYPWPDEAYMAGLVHNLGQLVFLAELPEQYAPLLGKRDEEQKRLAYERESRGVTSVEIGASLTRAWTRDALLSDAILFQDRPMEAVLDGAELIRLVNLSRRLIVADPWEDKSVVEDAQRLLGIGAGELLDIKAGAASERNAIIAGYGLMVDERGGVDRVKGVRRLLNEHVCDTAFVGAVEIAGSDDPWQAAVRQFEILFDVSGAVAFEYEPEKNLLHRGRCDSVAHGERLARLQIPVAPGRNIVAEACLRKTVLTTLDPELPEFGSVLHAQLQQIFGTPALVAMPVILGERVLGLLVAGLGGSQVEGLAGVRSRLDAFLGRVATQLETNAALQRGSRAADDLHLQEYISRTRQLIHEANNPLGVVANYLHVLSLKFEQDHETRRQIDVIRSEIDRVADILSSMRETPQDTENIRIPVNINELIKELVSVFRISLFEPRGIECVLRLDPGIGSVQSIPTHLKQLLTNLLKNSAEALEAKEQGTVTIETNDAVYFDGRECVRIVVADNGPGIAPNITGHLFTSAISSKGAPHSGVGLLMVKRLVSELGGNILVHSYEGEGARFELLFPKE